MASTQQALRNIITLKGSTQIVTEFFGYAVYSILYQRGIYPPQAPLCERLGSGFS